MPTPKSSSTGTRIKPTVEILPDTRFIVFAGDEHEASSVKLTGRVRLNCPEAMSICKPKIRLEGVRKVSWVFLGSITSGVAEDKRVFLNEDKPLGSIESTHKVKEGSIEWPFEFELPPSLPESVEGLRDTWIVYNLYATVSRPGWNQKDIVKHEHLRIVRTLGQESIEMTRSRVNADIWANKLSYSISIPSDAVIFGTSITADVELSPIRKGIKLGRVEMRLMETITKRLPNTTDGNETRHDRSKSEEKEVTRMQMDFPESAKVTYDEETVDNPVLQDEMYKFKATLPLPKSLHKCRQDVDSHQINISHRFKLMVNIHNPEGHISQLVCRLPVKLFISPNLPIDDSNEVLAHDGMQAAIDSLTATLSAPPQYGQHQLDQIFSDIDPSGYMSRAGSGPNTPAGLLAQSRRASEENLRSLNAVADMTPVHGSAAPYALAHALSNLQEADARPRMSRQDSGPSSASDTPYTQTRRSSPEHARSPPSRTRSAVVSPHGSAEGSRRASAEEQSQQYDLNSLSRVPSYNAAVRTPGPYSYNDGPPSYIDATSRPPSPRQRPTMPQAGSSGSLSLLAMRSVDENARLRTLRAQN